MNWLPGVGRGRGSDWIVSIAAITSLALGIGAATATFTLVNSLILRPIPVANPERLTAITTAEAGQRGHTEQYSYVTFDAIRRHRVADDAAAWSTSLLTIDGQGQAVSSMWVSGNLFSTLGVPAARGRTIAPADDITNGGSDGVVVMVSDRLWRQRFGGAADIIGRRVRVERTTATIVGVAPPGFGGVEVGRAFDLFVPIKTQATIESGGPLDEHAPYLWLLLRLRPDQSIEAATAALRVAQPAVRVASRPSYAALSDFLREPFVLEPAATGTSVYFGLRQRYSAPLYALLVLSLLLLVVACANVANLFLARGARRRLELTIRLALGASRRRLIRDLSIESAAFAAVGSVAGMALSIWASRLLVSQLAAEAQLAAEVQPLVMNLAIDWRILAFTSAIAATAVTIFGITPAVRATRLMPIETLKGGYSHMSGNPTRAQDVFVCAQIAVALLLVLTAGLFIRTFTGVTRVPLGFNPDGVLLGTLAAPTVSAADRNRLYHRLVDVAAGMPDVQHAGGALAGPLTTLGNSGIPLTVSNAAPGAAPTNTHIVDATPGWMASYGIQVLSGRDISASDHEDALPVMVVNETFARRFFPGENVLGRTVTVTGYPGAYTIGSKTIVGIVRDSVYDSVRSPVLPAMFTPLAQRNSPLFYSAFWLAVRPASGSLGGAVNRMSAALRTVSPDLRITFQPLAERVDAMLTQDRLMTSLSLYAGGLSLLLASIGLYGVTAYAVTARRREFGIRLALGSPPRRVVRLIVWQTMRPLVAGLVLGGAMSVWTGQIVRSLLFDVTPRDPLVLSGAVLALVCVGLVAAWWPAYRASLADPSVVLRQQ
jgi:putative ABC transport system permease protein